VTLRSASRTVRIYIVEGPYKWPLVPKSRLFGSMEILAAA
jgi:hypothetical protein